MLTNLQLADVGEKNKVGYELMCENHSILEGVFLGWRESGGWSSKCSSDPAEHFLFFFLYELSEISVYALFTPKQQFCFVQFACLILRSGHGSRDRAVFTYRHGDFPVPVQYC